MVLKYGKNHEAWIVEEWLDLFQGNEVYKLPLHFYVYCTPVSDARSGPKDHHHPAYAPGPLSNVGKFTKQNSQTATAEVTIPKQLMEQWRGGKCWAFFLNVVGLGEILFLKCPLLFLKYCLCNKKDKNLQVELILFYSPDSLKQLLLKSSTFM